MNVWDVGTASRAQRLWPTDAPRSCSGLTCTRFIPVPGRGVQVAMWGTPGPGGGTHRPLWRLELRTGLSLLAGLVVAEYEQPYGGFLDFLRGGTERLFTNIKDTSSKVIQSVAK